MSGGPDNQETEANAIHLRPERIRPAQPPETLRQAGVAMPLMTRMANWPRLPERAPIELVVRCSANLLAEKIKKAASEPPDARAMGFDNFTDAVKEGLLSISQSAAQMWEQGVGGHSDAAARLVTQMGGPLVSLLAPQSDAPTPQGRTVLLAMGAIGGDQLEKVTFAGKKKQFRYALVRRLIRLSGQNMDEKKLHAAVTAELKRMDLQRSVLKGEQKLSYFMVIDKAAAQELGLPAGATKAERAAALARALQTPDDIDKAFKAFDRMSKANVRLAALTGILQVAAWTKAADDEAKAMQHERAETKWKVYAAYSAVVGSTAEVLGHGAVRVQNLVLAGARGLRGASVTLSAAKYLRIVGNAMGAVAGFVVAFWDGMHAWEEFDQKNFRMAVLYGVSAALGIAVGLGALGVAAFAAWLPVLLVLLVVVIVLIEVFKDNKIEDWLERTLWGKWRDEYKGADPYKSVDTEMREFKLAIEAAS